MNITDIINNIKSSFQEVSTQIEAEEQAALTSRMDNFFVELEGDYDTAENRVLEAIRTGGSEHHNKLSLRSNVPEDDIPEIINNLIDKKEIIQLTHDENPIYSIKHDNFLFLKLMMGRK